MLKKIFATATALTCISVTYAQDSSEVAPKPKFSAYVDVYYRYNFSNPKKDAGTFNNFTSFTNSHSSFELNMASVKVEHAVGKVSMVADIGFGQRAEDFSYADDKTRFAIKQAYVSYAPLANLKFTAGSWATHVGYELVDAAANRNYSMSYMFSKGPFFHTGLKAEATLGKSGFMVGLTNPTDLKSANCTRKFIIAQYSIATNNDAIKTYVNYQGGNPTPETKMNQVDVTIASTLGKKFGLGYNGTVASFKTRADGKFGHADAWWGSAVYVNVDPSDKLQFTLRGELFDDGKMLTDVFRALPQGGNVFATTLTAKFKAANLFIIPELRFDNASKSIFIDNRGLPTKNTATALVAAVYAF